MQDASAELLSQLRDIQSAPPAPFWPPAPGWWVLAAIVLFVAGWLLLRAWRAWRVQQRRKALMMHLHALRQTHDPENAPQRYLSSVNRLLKVAAMRAFPAETPGALQGKDWVDFLVSKSSQATPEGNGALEPLATGPYQPQPLFDANSLESAAIHWLRRYG